MDMTGNSRKLAVMPEDWERALQQCKPRQATKRQEHTRSRFLPGLTSWGH